MKTKKDVLNAVVKSFPVYEVQQICLDGRRYPRRRISLQRVGFYDTKEHGEEVMREFLETEKKNYEVRGLDYHDDCLGYFLFELLVHDKPSSFYWNERPCKCYSFNADGVLNDFVALDEFGWYRGRKAEDIRFKIGDIVEIVDGGVAELAIIGGLPRTKECYRYLEESDEECEHPCQFLDESDDCYLVYPVDGEEGVHYHPQCYKVFPPTRPVSARITALLKARLAMELPAGKKPEK